MSWTHVQNSNHTNSGSAFTLVATTMGSSITVGNLLVAQVNAFNGTVPPITVTDSKGNSWTQGLHSRPGSASQQIDIWYTVITSGGTGDIVTASTGVSSTFFSICVDEYTFNAPLTLGASNVNTGSSAAPSSGSVTIAGNSLLVGTGTQVTSTSANPYGAGVGFNLRGSAPLVGSISIGYASVDALNVTNSQPVLFTLNASTSWQAVGLAFSETSAGGGVIIVPWEGGFRDQFHGGFRN